jgi:spore coat protein U-like protein
MPKYLRAVVVAVALAFALSEGPASAGTQTSTVGVTATVGAACTALSPQQSQTLTFPAYDAFGNQTLPDDAATPAQWTTQCTQGASNVNFQVDGGGNCASSPVSGYRAMKSGTDYLAYQLYESAPPGATAWPFDTSTCSALPGPTLTIASSTATQTLSIYGEIPAGQDPAVGNGYTDSVTVSVNF